MPLYLKKFAADESGAITVDWVVLTAGVVALGIAVMGVIFTPVGDKSEDISEFIANVPIDDTFN